MDWRQYENAIHDAFGQYYQDATIEFDKKIVGQYTGKPRQVDVWVELQTRNHAIKLMIDGKYHDRKIDVKGVETFIGMLGDVGANQGLMVTNKGYSDAAIKRAHNGPEHIELDILTFEELKSYQGAGGIVYADRVGALIPSPFGWVIDSRGGTDFLASLYRRGQTFEEGYDANEYITIHTFKKVEAESLADILEREHKRHRINHPEQEVAFLNGIYLPEGRTEETSLICMTRPGKDFLQFEGMINYGNFAVCGTLFTPKLLRDRNLRKLEMVLRNTRPVNVLGNTLTPGLFRRIEFLEGRLQEESDALNMFDIYMELGHLKIDSHLYDSAHKCFTVAIELIPNKADPYFGIYLLYLLEKKAGMDTSIEKAVDSISALYKSHSKHADVPRFLIAYIEEHGELADLHYLEAWVQRTYSNDAEVMGNLYYYIGNYHNSIGTWSGAVSAYNKARNLFRCVFSEEHHVFERIESNLEITARGQEISPCEE